MIKNILITGANGQLGNELKVLFSSYPQFRFFPTDIDTLDLCDDKSVVLFLEDNQIDCIINCAAYTAVDKAEDDKELCYKINRDAVKNLAIAANKKIKIIHISTDYVFDGKASEPYRENSLTHPQSVYGKSKLAGEEVLFEYRPDSIVIRTSWLYSSFGNNFVKTMIRLGNEKDSLNVVADQTGSPTYAGDLAATILNIAAYCNDSGLFPAGIYHYSNEGITNWYEFTLKIHEFSNIHTCKVNPITTAEYPTKAARPSYSVLDKTKIKETFGLEVPHWEDSLKKMINKYI